MPNATFNENIYEMFVNNVQPESTKRSHPFLGYEIKSNYEGKVMKSGIQAKLLPSHMAYTLTAKTSANKAECVN